MILSTKKCGCAKKYAPAKIAQNKNVLTLFSNIFQMLFLPLFNLLMVAV
jgi:hypothetical protein